MKTLPIELPPPTPLQEGAIEVVRRLQAAGFTALWAGGCVRDLLLRKAPKDYDVATEAVPDRVEALFPGSVTVGKAFGVVRAKAHGFEYEVATFREDRGYRDGRRPDRVVFADAAADAARRDFTINALFCDPLKGEVHDHVGGCADLEARIVRAVGDPPARFREDHLRLLRAARFTATLAFTLDPATAAAVRAHAGLVADVSAERVRDELTRLLTEAPQAGDALKLLDDLGLLVVTLPEVAAMKGQVQPPEYHPEGDVFEHTVQMLNAMTRPDARLAWAVLLHDVGKPPAAVLADGRWRFENHAGLGAELTRRILGRLRFSNDDIEAVAFMVGNHMRFVDVPNMRRATLRRLVGAPTFPTELELHRLDCVVSHGDLDNYRRLVAFQAELAAEVPLPPPWVRGQDVMALGIPEGPGVGRWLRRAYEVQLEGTYADRDALLRWLAAELRAARDNPR
jgi:poly(A) polymerase